MAEAALKTVLEDLSDRLCAAHANLLTLRNENQGTHAIRLDGKAEGVRLALSYVEEAIRVQS